VNVIVSSRFAVHVVDLDTNEIELIRTSGYESLYYGITWYQNKLFLGRRDLNSNVDSIVVLDQDLKYIDTIFKDHDALRDTHQMIMRGEELWITASKRNTVVIVDPTREKVLEEWRPVGNWGDDYNHFNSIWFYNDRIYVVAHNKGASQLYVFLDTPERPLESIRDMGMGSHNVCRSGTEVIVLSSGDGYAISNGGKVHNLYRNNYPRGVALGDSFSVVGLSEHCTDRGVRHKERRGAVQLYTHTGQLPLVGGTHIKTIELGTGMVLEVRGLDFPDMAHNNLPWRGRYGI